MEKYLIIIDLDGTTLNDAKMIHSHTLNMINQVSNMGHIVVISTGRAFYASQTYYKDLKLNTLIVNRNGAHIHFPHEESFSDYSVKIHRQVIIDLINSVHYSHIQEMYIEASKDLIVEKGNMEFFKQKKYVFNDIYHGYTNYLKDATMFTILVENEYVNQMLDYLKTYKDIKAECWYHNGEYKNTMIEVFPKDVDKMKAIDYLCHYYDIPLQRTIAIGDEVNDIEMIKYAGLGVAVGNAIEALKTVSDLVLEKTNNDGGVGHFLESFFNLDLNK